MPTARATAIHQALSLIGVVVIGAAWLVNVHYAPWTSFYNEACMGVGLAILFFARLPLRRPYRLPLVAWALVSVATLPWLQFLFGILTYSGDAWVATLYLFGFATAVAIGYGEDASEGKDLPTLLAGATLIAACVSSAVGIDQLLNGRNAQGNLGQANNLATAIGFGAVGLLFLRERNLIGKAVAIGLLCLLIVGAASTQSRTALIYGPLIASVVFAAGRYGPEALSTRWSVIAIASLLHWVLAFCLPLIHQSPNVSGVASVASRGLESSRFQAWSMFFAASKESPLLGYGWLETAEAQFETADRFPPLGELFFQAHNLPLELAIWCGYPIALLLIALCIVWFVSRTKKVARLDRDSRIAPLCGGLIVLLLAVHSMLELPYHYAYLLIPAGLWIGIIERAIQAESIGPPVLSLAASGAALILMVALSRDYIAVERDFERARIQFEQSTLEQSDQERVYAPLLSELLAYSNLLRTPPRVDMSPREIDEMRNAARRYPLVFSLTRFSFALAVNGRPDEARGVFLKIRSIHGLNRFESAKRYLHALIEQEKDSPLVPGLSALEASLPP